MLIRKKLNNQNSSEINSTALEVVNSPSDINAPHNNIHSSKEKIISSKTLKGRKVKLRKIFLIGFSIFLFLFLAGAGAVMAAFLYVAKDLPNPSQINNRTELKTSFLYDRNGKILSEVVRQDVRQDTLDIKNIPALVQDAVIAVEDKRFREHQGVDYLGIARAVVANVKGDTFQGASTLTQQVVRNILLTKDKDVRSGVESYKRKVKEAILAIQTEQSFSKDKILEMYLNLVPLGDVAYGVGAGADLYFGKKDLKTITLPESAMLAGMIHSPSDYNPFIVKDLSHWRERRNTVLDLMGEQGKITPEQTLASKNTLILRDGENPPEGFDALKSCFNKTETFNTNDCYENVKIAERTNQINAPHFTYWVQGIAESIIRERVDEKANFAGGGYKVTTSLDLDMSNLAQKVLQDHKGTTLKTARADNAALVAIDPKTGEMLAMAGNIDYNDKSVGGEFNVATSDERQMGSTFKVYDYAAAFKKGFTPDSIVYDVETAFPGWVKGKPPQNFSKTFAGAIAMKNSLPQSLNIPAIKAMHLGGGTKTTLQLAKDMGVESLNPDNPDYGLATAIGGAGIPLYQHTAGYATVANNGVRKYIEFKSNGQIRREPVVILKIEDSNGKVIFDSKTETKESRPLGDGKDGETVARYLQAMLSDNSLRTFLANRYPVTTDDKGKKVTWRAMMKTGTTNNVVDAAGLGATPNLAVGVWVGQHKNNPLNQSVGGEATAIPIWLDFMNKALQGKPVESFPSYAQAIKDKTSNSCMGTDKTLANGKKTDGKTPFIVATVDKESGKLATEFTPDENKEERKFYIPHSELHYINPSQDAPCQAPIPKDKDPQYTVWEEGVKKNLSQENKITIEIDGEIVYLGEPPTEYDDIHTEFPRPSINVVIQTNPVYKNQDISAQVNVDLKGNTINNIDVYLNGTRAQSGVTAGTPFVIFSPFGDNNTLEAKILDGRGRETTKSITFTAINQPIDPDLRIRNFVHTPTNFKVGVSGKYTATIENVGTGATTDTITFIDTLPAELDFVSATGTGWTCSNSGQTVTCTRSSILAPSAITQIDIFVTPTSAGDITNTANVSTPGESNTGNNSASDLTHINP